MFDLRLGDCLEVMADIPDGSVDLVLCDPPYGTMAGAGLDGWDEKSTAWDVALEPDSFLEHCNRVLRVNGALILFSQEPYTSRLITEAHSNIPFSYRMTWLKDHFANALLAKKAPVSYFEDVLAFFKKHTKHDFEGFHPLRPYAADVAAFIGKPKKQIFAEMGHQGMCHFMRHDSTQFSICTEATYSQLVAMYGLDKMPGFKTYAEMKPINDKYRSGLIAEMARAAPKVFNLPDGEKYKSNVLRYKKDYDGFHPTQKPVALLTDLIQTYSNEGDTVLDFTMGSGSTGVACANTGRHFIGIERDPGYFEIARSRIEQAHQAQVA